MAKSSKAQIKANIKYNASHVTQFKIGLNNKTDADIIEHLNKQNNKQGYIKELIRNDISNKQGITNINI